MDNQQQNQKQNYDEKRLQREAEAKKSALKRKIRKVAIWSLVVTILLLAGKYLWKANQEAGRVLKENEQVTEVQGEFFKSQGQDHIKIDAEHPAYSSNPPTSGWHYEVAHATGVYKEEFPDEQLVHNLEHGHIWISYRPDVGADTIAKLEAIYKRFGSKVIVVPRAKNDGPIAIAAWEYLLKLDSYDETQILGFVKAHRGKGPEDIPDMGI